MQELRPQDCKRQECKLRGAAWMKTCLWEQTNSVLYLGWSGVAPAEQQQSKVTSKGFEVSASVGVFGLSPPESRNELHQAEPASL